MITNALIIAAGAGSRLQEITGQVPKPLLSLAGLPLLKRIILTAHSVDIDKFVIVTGHEVDQFHAVLREDPEVGHLITWVHNDDWQKPNGVSVLTARDHLPQPFVLLMADHIFEAQTLQRFLETPLNPDECILAIDRKIDTIYDLDDATKVRTKDGLVVEISKTLTTYDAIDTGMFLCTPSLFDALASCLDEEGCSLSDGIQTLAQNGKMRVHDIQNGFWQDIDTPEMFDYAEQMMRRHLQK